MINWPTILTIAQTASVDAFPQTSYLQQTNSLGVVTGMPAAATSIPTQPAADTIIPTQPAADTDVGIPASIPAVAPGIYTVPVAGGVNSTKILTVSANNSTTIILSAPTSNSASATGSDASATGTGRHSGSGSPSSTASGTGASSSTGAAANLKAAAGSMVGFGAFVAAFL